MHPPPFRLDHHLSDWPDCKLELHCGNRAVIYPVALLVAQSGDRTFARLLAALRCDRCGKQPSPVYLCAGHRERAGLAPADWAIELVPRGAA